MAAVNVNEEYSQLCELPDDFIEETLAWLPVESLFRFDNVCKQWNTLFSSTSFITGEWAQAPPNKNPWLVVGAMDYNHDCWAYSSFTRSWKNSCLSLSLLEGINEAAPPNTSSVSHHFRYLGSGAGLFLIQGKCSRSIYVCNPLTGKDFVLPLMTYIDKFSFGEIGLVQEGEDGYAVLAIYHSVLHGQKIVEIYDSRDKAWRIAGRLPEYLKIFQDVGHVSFGTVFSGGYFYCLMFSILNQNTGIMCFNIVEGTSIFVPLPRVTQDFSIYYLHLVACGSRILYVHGIQKETHVEGEMETETQDEMEMEIRDEGGIEIEIHFEEEVIIWEFNKDAATKWQDIARMPQTMLRIFNSITWRKTPFECAGMGDSLYFKKHSANEVVVYNLTENSWTFLPSCPVDAVLGDPSLVVFNPRPDMKVQ